MDCEFAHFASRCFRSFSCVRLIACCHLAVDCVPLGAHFRLLAKPDLRSNRNRSHGNRCQRPNRRAGGYRCSRFSRFQTLPLGLVQTRTTQPDMASFILPGQHRHAVHPSLKEGPLPYPTSSAHSYQQAPGSPLRHHLRQSLGYRLLSSSASVVQCTTLDNFVGAPRHCRAPASVDPPVIFLCLCVSASHFPLFRSVGSVVASDERSV